MCIQVFGDLVIMIKFGQILRTMVMGDPTMAYSVSKLKNLYLVSGAVSFNHLVRQLYDTNVPWWKPFSSLMVSDVKLEREVKVGNRKISPDDMFASCLVVNGVVISTSFDGRMIEMIAELNSEGVEFHSYDRDTREFVQISYVPGGIMKKVKWYRVV